MSATAQQIPLRRFERIIGPSGTRIWRRVHRTAVSNRVRFSCSELARQVGVTEGAIRYGVRRLTELGVLHRIGQRTYRINVKVNSKTAITVYGIGATVASRKVNKTASVQKLLQRYECSTTEHTHLHKIERVTPDHRVKILGRKMVKVDDIAEETSSTSNSVVQDLVPRGPRARTIESQNIHFTLPPTGGEKFQTASLRNADLFSSNLPSSLDSLDGSALDTEELSALHPTFRHLAKALTRGSVSSSCTLPRTHLEEPPYPSSKLVRAARIPSPPRLNPKASPEDWFVQIARTWINTVHAYYGPTVDTWEFHDAFPRRVRRSYVDKAGIKQERIDFRPAQPRKSKLWKRVIAWAEQLIEQEIAPAAWITFRFDVWHEQLEEKLDFTKQGAVPTASWVMTPGSVIKHLDWYLAEETKYVIGATVMGPLHRALILDWQRMSNDLRWLPDTTPSKTIKQIIAKFFPGDLYNVRLREAQQEARERQLDLNNKVQRGQNYWSVR